ncbi:MAG: hypothetical protein IPK07_14095 [Deltaproteobacteria bacterium]|nr:hypothetical protein [Deltaproteobacteria bacterium]
MKLDVFAARRRNQPEQDPHGGASKERRDDGESDEPKSWGDRLKKFAEVLNQPIGQGAKADEKARAKGREGHDGPPRKPEKPMSWAEEMGMVVPAKPADAKARQEADDAIAQGTYHLKRGNREQDVRKKIQCFEEALADFQKLKALVPNDPSVAKQVEMVERGLTELRAAYERYRAANPEGPSKP